jgi:thiamine kinase-like enzyme
MPEILHEFEITSSEVHWHAIQFSLALSPTVSDRAWIASPLRTIENEWLTELRQAIETVNRVPLTRWLVHPGRVARAIVQRFGKGAPYIIDEWRTAHGDLNWGNVTAPNLMLLDWEFWGAAPQGYDAATLLSHTFMDEELFRRIEATFVEDLNTPSGIVARLFRFAQVLDDVEAGIRDPREHRIAEAEARRLLRL